MTLNSALRRSRQRISGRLRGWAGKRRTEIRLAMRVTAASVATFALVHVLGMPQGYWAVFTAVLIMQTSLGGSVQAITDRMMGTLGGASLGTVAAALAPHGDVIAMGVALAATVAPLAMLAAVNSSFRVAPITAVIVLIGTGEVHESPLEAGFFRMLSVALGSVVGLVVSLSVLPARAHAMMCRLGAQMLSELAELLRALLGGLLTPADTERISELHDQIRRTLSKLENAAEEAQRERRSYLSEELDPDPIPRTLRRLHHDLVMIGRTASQPLPVPAREALAPAVAKLSDTIADYLLASGNALATRKVPAEFTASDQALAEFAVEVAALYSKSELSRDAKDRISALGFALDQLRRDCKDLTARIAEFAKSEVRMRTQSVP
ncbi:MAG: FUSC family protein [Alphaproteobacteria bacterium]